MDEHTKERKQKRERERFASVSKERRNELNKKRRESYKCRKGNATLSIMITVHTDDHGFLSLVLQWVIKMHVVHV